MRTTLLILLVLSFSIHSYSQNQSRKDFIKQKLELISVEEPGLLNEIDISVEDIMLSQFLHAIAAKNKINIDFSEDLPIRISSSFSNITVSDLLIFVCEKYNLDINVNNSIITFFSVPVEGSLVEYLPKELKILYDVDNGLFSYDLQNDTLSKVTRKLTEFSGINIILTSDLFNRIVNGFAKNVSIKQALDQLSISNNLKLQVIDSMTYMLTVHQIANSPNQQQGFNQQLTTPAGLQIKESNGLLTIDANNVPTLSIIELASKELKKNYFLFSEIKGNSTLKLSSVTYDELLKNLFNGTENTFRYENNTFLMGDRNMEGIRMTKVIQLKYRTVEKVIDFIPADLKKDMEVKMFTDLNSLIISGAMPQIKEVENFIFDIDKIVPVISIEVIILDIRKNNSITTGIQAGVGKTKSESTYSSIFPNIDVNLNSNAINNIITAINGLGIVNIGKVTPNFYLSLKASEANGTLKIVSTPRLAALNGNEAKLKIGETRYYVEQTSNIITTQSTTTVNAIQYKPLQANLEIGIKPSVSSDEQITLDIDIQQSSFTDQLIKDGPFGSINRSFHSNIRVKNEEMIILGGLTDKNLSENGTGTPLLSRIPILKWFFSNRNKNSKKSNLVILVKPTLYY